MNWGDFVSVVRTDLGDSETTPKLTNALLYSYARSAIHDVSAYFPRRFDHVALEVDAADPKKFALPSDFIEEIVVECPEGNALSARQSRPGFRRTPAARPLFYEISGNALYLDADPGGSAVLLTYSAVHGLPASADDVTFDLTNPARDIELVQLYVKALCEQRARTKQASLDRFKLGSGDRQDNPIAPEVTDYFAEYRDKIAERSGGVIYLNRPRKYR
jgi:hypothetical protein